jgi:hypothetical protein
MCNIGLRTLMLCKVTAGKSDWLTNFMCNSVKYVSSYKLDSFTFLSLSLGYSGFHGTHNYSSIIIT